MTNTYSSLGICMEKSTKYLIVHIDNGICTITLDRPEFLNVFNEETLNEFARVLDEVSNNKKVKVVVLLSACEKAFTAGADIKEMVVKEPNEAKKFSQLGHNIARKLETIPQPVIIGVHGYVLGGGVEFSCACDIRIAAEDSIFAQPEIDIGVIPGWGGTQRLSRIVGIGKAKEIIYTGKRIDAHEALEIGLVNNVVPKDKLIETVMAMAKTMASKGKLALFDAKKSINQLYETFIEDGLDYEIDRWTELFDTEDQKEGMRAFLEGRHPEFKDK
jgi:enoyl-CoA hydratase